MCYSFIVDLIACHWTFNLIPCIASLPHIEINMRLMIPADHIKCACSLVTVQRIIIL